ncbi:MAG: saccharopine dehydrogenase NADP-binding domain-containing protein [Candidatus Eremiobacteraeota bacterium]|nr:saccharopine dehydrogenase NADP-binding domain-containing protein [Candidatus Eremiobacteraeota bacterium]MCL5056107.1 saccharopine dehydrogenase NADP-binding domain-containing protein [Bacillota bacterium]
MKYNYAILGAGQQGTAAAYDMALFGEASQILLLDINLSQAEKSAQKVNRLTGRDLVHPLQVDVTSFNELTRALSGCHAVLSAVPYYFNPTVAKAAIQVKANLCDLGGNTQIVFKQHELHDQAQKAGVSIVPDCGLAPGMGNTLAVYAMEKLDLCSEIKIRCGGLPQNPKPPFYYKLVFSMEGLINEYSGKATVLRNGKIMEIPAFSEVETLEFPTPVGNCEAFVTTGGTSTCPWSFEGKLQSYDYKTVRYPGHYEKMKLFFDLGFFDPEPIEIKAALHERKIETVKVSPRAFFSRMAAPAMSFPEDPDLVVLRVTAKGEKNRRPAEIQLDILDFQDPKTGFSAMERTTGFPASIVAIMLAKGGIEKGVISLEKAVPGGLFVKELSKRGIHLTETA